MCVHVCLQGQTTSLLPWIYPRDWWKTFFSRNRNTCRYDIAVFCFWSCFKVFVCFVFLKTLWVGPLLRVCHTDSGMEQPPWRGCCSTLWIQTPKLPISCILHPPPPTLTPANGANNFWPQKLPASCEKSEPKDYDSHQGKKFNIVLKNTTDFISGHCSVDSNSFWI